MCINVVSLLNGAFDDFHLYDATGIVTAAREYRAGRAKVLFTVRLHHLHDEKIYIVEIMKMF
jgi:hypothetical protein